MPVAAQTRLYHPALAGTPPEEGNWNPLGGSFPTPLYHGSAELAERPASMQACIPVGERAQVENAIFTARSSVISAEPLSLPNALLQNQ